MGTRHTPHISRSCGGFRNSRADPPLFPVCGDVVHVTRGRRRRSAGPPGRQPGTSAAPGTAWHSTGPAARRPWGFPTCTGLRIPAGQASLGCAYAHPNCPSCAWAVLCIWPTQTQGLLINWTCWLLAGSAHDFTRKLFARKLQARLGHWAYTACAVLGLWCHAAGTIGKIPAWKNYRRQNPSRGKVPGLEIPAARNYWADPGISTRDPGLRLALPTV